MPLTRNYIEDMERLGQNIPTDRRCCNYHASGGVIQDCNPFPLSKAECDDWHKDQPPRKGRGDLDTARENRIRERANQRWRDLRDQNLRRREVEAMEERNRIEREKLRRGL